MDEMKVLLHAIETLSPGLPGLVGADWPQFQIQLNAYLDEFQQNPDRSPVLRAQILALFGNHREAHRRLVELIAEFRALYNKAALMVKSPDAFERSLARLILIQLRAQLHPTVTLRTRPNCDQSSAPRRARRFRLSASAP